MNFCRQWKTKDPTSTLGISISAFHELLHLRSRNIICAKGVRKVGVRGDRALVHSGHTVIPRIVPHRKTMPVEGCRHIQGVLNHNSDIISSIDFDPGSRVFIVDKEDWVGDAVWSEC